jgi:hypothetical protein
VLEEKKECSGGGGWWGKAAQGPCHTSFALGSSFLRSEERGGGSIPVCPYDILVSLALVPRLSDLLFVLCACLRLPWGVCLPDS